MEEKNNDKLHSFFFALPYTLRWFISSMDNFMFSRHAFIIAKVIEKYDVHCNYINFKNYRNV